MEGDAGLWLGDWRGAGGGFQTEMQAGEGGGM